MSKKEKTAVVTLTRKGQDLAIRIKEFLNDLDIYCKDKYRIDSKEMKGINYYNSSVKELTAGLFRKYKSIIYIMALGIVVRVISPYLVSKKVDPAIITIDETGQNVISTLSGHLGGANELALKLAEILNANPVITTATDCQAKPSIDILAKNMGCEIKPFKNLKLANAAIVNDMPLSIFTDYNIEICESKFISIYQLSQLSRKRHFGFMVIISNRVFKLEDNYIQLIPRNIIVGIGCRRGVSIENIKYAVEKSMESLNLNDNSIKKLATIDLKKDEVGLIEYAAWKSLDIDIVDRELINNANLDINRSEFVQKMVGVPGVCEPAALLSSSNGRLILPKMKYNNVTIAIVEEEV